MLCIALPSMYTHINFNFPFILIVFKSFFHEIMQLYICIFIHILTHTCRHTYQPVKFQHNWNLCNICFNLCGISHRVTNLL